MRVAVVGTGYYKTLTILKKTAISRLIRKLVTDFSTFFRLA